MKQRGSKRWLPLEANPELIQKYAKGLGGPAALTFSDVLSTEDWAIEMVAQPVVGVLLLFPMKAEGERIRKERREAAEENRKGKEDDAEGVWFTRQRVSNACGTIAVLHLLTNAVDEELCENGGFLTTFLRQMEGKSAEEIGKALEENDEIEKAHQDVEHEGQSAVPSRDDEVEHHFIAFIEKDGRLFELDGDKTKPFCHCATSKETLLRDAVAAIKKNFIDIDPDDMRFQIIAATLPKEKAKEEEEGHRR